MSTDKKADNRPWWRKKTNYGICCSILGGVIVLTPGAPVVFAVWTLPVTTTMIGMLLTSVGAAWGSYGAAKRADLVKEKK